MKQANMLRYLLSIIFICIVLNINAQVKDTVKYARELAYEKNFKEADRILSLYNKKGNDVYGLWLQAQIVYWMGETDKALNLYKILLDKNPEMDDLHLDYGRVLFESGKLNQAKQVLRKYLKINPTHVESLIMLTYIDFWNGKISKSKNQAEQLLKSYPDNIMVRKLFNEIMLLSAPYVKAGSTFFSDDQPLIRKAYEVEVGKHHSWLLSPKIIAGVSDFFLSHRTVRSNSIGLSNKFTLGSSGPSLIISGGVFQPINNESKSEFIGSLLLSQKLSNHFFIDIYTGKRPYQHTLTSIDSPLMQSVSSIGLRTDNPEKTIGKLAYEQQVFLDNNVIHTTYAYLLKPVINKKAFRFDLGYSFNFSHSIKNSFRQAEPITQTTEVNTQLNGIYDPYFTPRNQIVNSLLMSVKIVPVKNIEVKFRYNYGFYAKADNPIIYVKRKGKEIITEKYFGEVSYTPLELYTEIKANVSKRFSISANYQFSRLFFYKFNQLGLSVNYLFLQKQKS